MGTVSERLSWLPNRTRDNYYHTLTRLEEPAMPSSVNLGEKLEAFISEAVKTGRYGSRSEVLREGVRLVQEREALMARTMAEIQKGIDSAERGDLHDLDEVADRLRKKYQAMAAKRDAA